MNVPDMKERLTTIGFDLVASTPEEFDSRIRDEIEKWGHVIRAGNIKPQ
jgi:tripartite-type tricarboxylate transporter receptor subunit TctC